MFFWKFVKRRKRDTDYTDYHESYRAEMGGIGSRGVMGWEDGRELREFLRMKTGCLRCA